MHYKLQFKIIFEEACYEPPSPPPPQQLELSNHIIIFNIIKEILKFNILLLKYTLKLTIYQNLPHQWRIQGRGPPPPRNALGVVNLSFFPKFIKKMSYDVEFSKFLLNIL